MTIFAAGQLSALWHSDDRLRRKTRHAKGIRKIGVIAGAWCRLNQQLWRDLTSADPLAPIEHAKTNLTQRYQLLETRVRALFDLSERKDSTPPSPKTIQEISDAFAQIQASRPSPPMRKKITTLRNQFDDWRDSIVDHMVERI